LPATDFLAIDIENTAETNRIIVGFVLLGGFSSLNAPGTDDNVCLNDHENAM
jgi:hypothetical protein